MVYLNLIRLETEFIMRSQSTMKKKPGAKRRRRPLPGQYLCIAEAEAPLVFDWLSGAGTEADRELAEIHLRLCFHCQEAVAQLMVLDEKFRASAGRSLHLSISSEHSNPADSDIHCLASGKNSSGQSSDIENPTRFMKVVGRG